MRPLLREVQISPSPIKMLVYNINYPSPSRARKNCHLPLRLTTNRAGHGARYSVAAVGKMQQRPNSAQKWALSLARAIALVASSAAAFRTLSPDGHADATPPTLEVDNKYIEHSEKSAS